jgi:hypothetical protein
MPAQILGIDSLVVSSSDALANATSADYLGQAPAFWGRYFYAPGQINSSGHKDSHYSAAENGFLRSNGIRLLPLARQTGRVGTDSATGSIDARHNVDAIFECFPPAYLAGADPNVLVFLDVEPEVPLDPDYYAGWSSTITTYSSQASRGSVEFKPAIYASTRDDATWSGLARALAGGSSCFGVYVARYFYGSPKPDRGWQPSILTPTAGVTPPILAWQYWASADDAPADENFDTNIASPYHSDALLDGLIMPPPPAETVVGIAPTVMVPGMPFQPAGDPPWLIQARSFIGTTWNNGPMPATIKAWMQEIAAQFSEMAAECQMLEGMNYWKWCGGFVQSMLAYSNIRGPFGATDVERWPYALAWETWGTDASDNPQPGDVLVFKWPGGGEHVAFYDHEVDDDNYHFTGGDQGTSCTVSTESASMSFCVAVRRPPAALTLAARHKNKGPRRGVARA